MHVASNRRYIGLTSRTMDRRWAQHVVQARSSKGGRWHFPNAVRKYGPKGFSHQVLGIYPTLEKGNWFEKFWIFMFDTTNPEKGFNLSTGGGSRPHPIKKNPWYDPAYRQRSIKAAKLRANTPRLHAILVANGKKSKGRVHSASTRLKLRRSNKSNQPEVRAKISAALTKMRCKHDHSMKDAYVINGRRRCRVCCSIQTKNRRARIRLRA